MKFTDSHEWIHVEEGIGTVGITSHAVKELGEIVYVELPTIGKHIRAGQEVAVLESTKAAADIYAPVSGEIIEINQHLSQHPEAINQKPEQEGWLYKVRLAHLPELEELLNHKQYENLIS